MNPQGFISDNDHIYTLNTKDSPVEHNSKTIRFDDLQFDEKYAPLIKAFESDKITTIKQVQELNLSRYAESKKLNLNTNPDTFLSGIQLKNRETDKTPDYSGNSYPVSNQNNLQKIEDGSYDSKISILNIGLPLKYANILARSGVQTCADLLNLNEKNFHQIPGLGQNDYLEVKKKLDSFFSKNIFDIGLSLRVANALRRSGVQNISDLLKTDEEFLCHVRYLDKTGYDEVIEKIHSFAKIITQPENHRCDEFIQETQSVNRIEESIPDETELSSFFCDPSYRILISQLMKDQIYTIEQFKQLNFIRYLNQKDLYPYKERQQIIASIKQLFASDERELSIAEPETQMLQPRVFPVGVKSNQQTIDFNRTIIGYNNIKPCFFIINGRTFYPTGWAALLIQFCEYMIVKNPAAMLSLTKQPLFFYISDPYFSDKEINGHESKQLSNGTRVVTDYHPTRIVQMLKAVCKRCGMSTDDLTICYEKNQQAQNKVLPTLQDVAPADIEDQIKNCGHAGVTVKELQQWNNRSTRLRQTAITQIVESNPQIVEIEKWRYIHRSIIVDFDEAATAFLQILQTQFAQLDGYSNSHLLFNAAKVDSRLTMFINDNAFDNEAKIYNLAKHLFSKEKFENHEYIFSGNLHIFAQEPDYPLNLKGLMIHLARSAGGLITRKDCEDFLEKAELGYPSIKLVLQVTTDSTFLQYDEDQYLLTEAMGIDDNWLTVIKAGLDQLFADTEFVIPRDIEGIWFDRLPALPLGLTWTPLLLQEVLQFYPGISYKMIPTGLEGQALDTVAPAIVPENSSVLTFADVVFRYLSNLNQRGSFDLPHRMPAEDLRLLLREAGMVKGNELILNLHKAINDYRFVWSDQNKTVYIRQR